MVSRINLELFLKQDRPPPPHEMCFYFSFKHSVTLGKTLAPVCSDHVFMMLILLLMSLGRLFPKERSEVRHCCGTARIMMKIKEMTLSLSIILFLFRFTKLDDTILGYFQFTVSYTLTFLLFRGKYSKFTKFSVLSLRVVSYGFTQTQVQTEQQLFLCCLFLSDHCHRCFDISYPNKHCCRLSTNLGRQQHSSAAAISLSRSMHPDRVQNWSEKTWESGSNISNKAHVQRPTLQPTGSNRHQRIPTDLQSVPAL